MISVMRTTPKTVMTCETLARMSRLTPTNSICSVTMKSMCRTFIRVRRWLMFRSRFEEIVDEPPKEASKKRPRESDATESEQPSKAEKKKQKKQKGENGEAVEAPTQEKKEKGKQKEKEKGEKEKKPKGETKTLAGGVQVVDYKVGTGPKAKSGNVVSMRYIGKLQNGKIFDQNKSGKPVSEVICRGL